MANFAHAALLAYYPLDNAPASITPDLAPGGTAYDATLTAGTAGAPSIVSGGMFGNALSVPGSANRAEVADGASDFDVLYDQFSLSVWIQPTEVDTAANRYITGKSGGGGQRGWFLRTNSGATINQLQFSYPRLAGSSSTQNLVTTLATPLSTTEFTHVAVQYDDADGLDTVLEGPDSNTFVRIYVNGILQASTTTTTIAATMNGSNNAPFQIGNRGDNLDTATDKSFSGLIDDLALSNDPSTPEIIALVHGLGRLAGVSVAESTQIADVLAAYASPDPSDTAIAGTGAAAGTIWGYDLVATAGTPIGTIGGTVAGGDAFIVLGADGSGVSVVPIPEPNTFAIIALGLVGIAGWMRRRRKD